MSKKIILVSALVALVVSFGVSLYVAKGVVQGNLGSLSERNIQALTLRIGEDGSTVGTAYKFVKSGTCTILANASVAATTTANFDCAFTGVRSGDLVFAHLTASSTLASQYVIKGYVASSTNGYITFSILNLTGGAAVPAATNGFGSSTAIQIWRTQ